MQPQIFPAAKSVLLIRRSFEKKGGLFNAKAQRHKVAKKWPLSLCLCAFASLRFVFWLRPAGRAMKSVAAFPFRNKDDIDFCGAWSGERASLISRGGNRGGTVGEEG